jgi:hypothetical protein
VGDVINNIKVLCFIKETGAVSKIWDARRRLEERLALIKDSLLRSSILIVVYKLLFCLYTLTLVLFSNLWREKKNKQSIGRWTLN